MVTQRVSTPSALGEIEGAGTARIDKYARHFLPLLKKAFASAPAANPANEAIPD